MFTNGIRPMRKFLRIVLVLAGVFCAGYYVGQQPPEEVKRQLQTMSDEVVDRAHDLSEGELFLQKELLDAKSRFLDGKAEILEGKYDEAVARLEETLHHLQTAIKRKGKETSRTLLAAAMAKIQDLQRSLADGRDVSREEIDNAQKGLDSLLRE